MFVYPTDEGGAAAVMKSSELIVSDADVLGGTPVFAGTRVPVRTLIDYLEGGQPLDEFLDDFPTVTHGQATAVLELAREALLAGANADTP